MIQAVLMLALRPPPQACYCLSHCPLLPTLDGIQSDGYQLRASHSMYVAIATVKTEAMVAMDMFIQLLAVCSDERRRGLRA